MLSPSDLTIVKNSDGIPTALGYPINSMFLNTGNMISEMVGGKKSKQHKVLQNYHEQFENLAIPAGLLCMNKKKNVNSNHADTDANANAPNMHVIVIDMEKVAEPHMDDDRDHEVVSDSLFDQLLALSEPKHVNKPTRRRIISPSKNKGKSKGKKTKKLKRN